MEDDWPSLDPSLTSATHLLQQMPAAEQFWQILILNSPFNFQIVSSGTFLTQNLKTNEAIQLVYLQPIQIVNLQAIQLFYLQAIQLVYWHFLWLHPRKEEYLLLSSTFASSSNHLAEFMTWSFTKEGKLLTFPICQSFGSILHEANAFINFWTQKHITTGRKCQPQGITILQGTICNSTKHFRT